jgi:Ca2+:H+ antiporter
MPVAAWALVLVPVSAASRFVLGASSLWTFAAAALAVVPLAEWMRRATEQLAKHGGTAVGGLLNVTFGNAAEFILALFVLAEGEPDVVKAQITGAIVGNSLLGLGAAIVLGTWGRERQTFNREQAGLLSSLLILSVIALLLPALFDYTERGAVRSSLVGGLDERLSLGVSVVLILVYAANLAYTLVTHRDVFAPARRARHAEPSWTLATSLAVLLGATAAAAFEAELVAGALNASAAALRLSSVFLGVVVLAVVGNAAEYVSAAYFARQDRLGLALGITVGSTIQVALLVAPVLVIVSYFLGTPMNLVFRSPLELIAIAGVAFAVGAIAHDGEATWFEGVLLLAVWAVLALAFFFVMPTGASAAA